MKLNKAILTGSALVGVLFGASLEAQGAGSVTPPACLVERGTGPALRGPVAVFLTDYDGFTAVADVTIRLRWRGSDKFFRVRPSERLSVGSPEDAACDILAANPVTESGQTILEAFGFPASKVLKITSQSVKKLDLNFIPGVPETASVLADIVLFVQDPSP